MKFDAEKLSPARSLTQAPRLSTSTDHWELMRENERYRWFADRLRPAVSRHDVAELTATLAQPALFPAQHEKSMVLLSLMDGAGAREALEGLDVSQRSRSFRLLHQIATRQARQ